MPEASQAAGADHVTVFRDRDRFAGWPANFGMWSWDDELVLVFTVGHHASTAGFHAVDGSKGFTTFQARSLDGGVTWAIEPFSGMQPSPHGLSVDEHLPPAMKVAELLSDADWEARFPPVTGPDLTEPELAVMAGRTDLAAGAASWLYASDDRCRSWRGPFRLPDFDVPGVAARTDLVRRDRHDLVLMLTAAKSDGTEGRVFAARSTDGGHTFTRLGWLGEEPAGYQIMPATVGLADGSLLSAVRVQDPSVDPTGTGPMSPNRIELYASDDGGETWRWAGIAVEDTGRGGNPPTLTRLADGRLVLIYGYRAEPFGIRARVSTDNGATWGPEIALRSDGGCHDLGYPRTVVRSDGALVTAYYFNDAPDGERYIAATIWHP